MKHFKPLVALSALLVLAGCSSPPEPAAVEWDKPLSPTNGTLPLWQENAVVTPSPVVSGQWSRVIMDFQDDGRVWTPDVWYAVAHSPRVAVSAPDATAFFAAKAWLRQHGAQGLISYRPKTHCLTCNTTDIYFSR